MISDFFFSSERPEVGSLNRKGLSDSLDCFTDRHSSMPPLPLDCPEHDSLKIEASLDGENGERNLCQ